MTEAERLERIEGKLDNALEFINGNGKPGAKERLARLELIAAGLVAVVTLIIGAYLTKLIGGHS